MDILNYRDDGDTKWRRRADIIVGAMNRNGLTWTDIYGETGQTAGGEGPSGSGIQAPELCQSHTSDEEYPEWGIVEKPRVRATEPDKENQGGRNYEAFVKRISTIPPAQRAML